MICNRCRHEQDVDQFVSEKYRRATKLCLKCRVRDVMYNKNNRCQHRRAKKECRECVRNDPKVILAQQMLRHSKSKDKKRGRYDPENHITKDEILDLFEEYPTCIWCECDVQYIHHQNNLATIERLCNSIGHLSGNCVIACFYCNVVRKSDGYGVPHICVICSTGEGRQWFNMNEGWHCNSCWRKIQVRCQICDKKMNKGSLYLHNKRFH